MQPCNRVYNYMYMYRPTRTCSLKYKERLQYGLSDTIFEGKLIPNKKAV